MSISGSSVRVEGHAIISSDGMIAAADGTMPDQLKVDADWQLFQAALDRSALVVLGRLGHLRHPNPGRRRLVLTRTVTDLVADAADPLATLWNPGGLDLAEVLRRLGISEGTVAVTGGTGVFDLAIPHYDSFVLSEVRGLEIPGGIPCFSTDHPRFVLPGAGLGPTDMHAIAPGVVQTSWTRDARVAPGSC
ncbi:MAG: dihydrofolate reductase [Devosia sp.]|nr:dihydrofolate reductase [Devosia sp.]